MTDTLRVKIKDHWFIVDIEDLEASPIRVMVDDTYVLVHLRDQTVSTDVEQIAIVSTEQPSISASQPRVFGSPMPGVVLSIAVQIGDQVMIGDEICVLEAMKMQQSLRAEWSGTVKAIHVSPGQQVLDGDAIAELSDIG